MTSMLYIDIKYCLNVNNGEAENLKKNTSLLKNKQMSLLISMIIFIFVRQDLYKNDILNHAFIENLVVDHNFLFKQI